MQKIFETLSKKWGLVSDGKQIKTHSSHLYFVKKDNIPAVLKIFKQDSDEKQSEQVLKAYGGIGAVKILAKSKEALLLERLEPGDDLSSLTIKENAATTEIFCQVAAKLHRADCQKVNCKNVEELSQDFDTYLKSEDKAFADSEILEAKSIFDDLASTQNDLVLLHGDLHHYNILRDKKRGWIAIDPKGYIGERECEVGPFLRNPIDDPDLYCDEAILERRINIIAKHLKLDRERMLQWAYVQTILAISYGVQEKSLEGWMRFAGMLRHILQRSI